MHNIYSLRAQFGTKLKKPAVSPQMAIEISMEHHQSFDDRPFQADDFPMQVRLAQEYLRTVSRLSTSRILQKPLITYSSLLAQHFFWST